MTTLLDKSKRLVELREAIAIFDGEYEKSVAPLKEERDGLQMSILAELKDTQQLSVKYDFGMFSRAVRKTPQVVDESKVIAWLKKNTLAKQYTATRLTDSFITLAKEMMKQEKKVDGVEIRETEYISVTKPSDKEDKRKVTTD